VSGKKHKNF